jgi:hypothetical protein
MVSLNSYIGNNRRELECRGKRRTGIAMEQILASQFGESRVDRCVTCHIASDDSRFKDHFHP